MKKLYKRILLSLVTFSVERQRNKMVKYWIQLNFGGDVSDSEILDL